VLLSKPGPQRQARIVGSLGETAPFHDTGEDAHGVEAIHCSIFRIMMSDYA
jgi:hypothetical protein